MSPSKLSPQRSKKPIDVEARRVEKLEGVKDKRKQGLQIDMMESHMKAEAETECLGALFVWTKREPIAGKSSRYMPQTDNLLHVKFSFL